MSDFDYATAFKRTVGWVTATELEKLRRTRAAIGGVGGSHLLTLPPLALLLTALLLTALPPTAHADLAAGRDLAERGYNRPDGTDAAARGSMTLTGERRRERVRETYTYRLDGEAGERKEMVRFTSPANIAGTGLLVHNHPDGSSDQWLYLPAADRVRRVSGDNRGQSFVQSDLYFEDMEDRPPHKDEHRLLGSERYRGTETKLLESVPVDPDNSAYSKRRAWIHPQTLIALRVDFYQGGEEPAKRLEIHEVQRIQGYWTVMRSTMTDLERGTQTVMAVDEIAYDQDLPQELFSTHGLANPRREEQYQP